MADPCSPTERFGDRAAEYARHRPGYPAALGAWLRQTGIGPGPVADIGAGTGQSARLWRGLGRDVVAIEPNDAMRAAGEAALADAGVAWRKATAEDTTLDAASVGVVSTAQAFHWFDRDRVRAEWRRILRPGGSVVVFWNQRATQRSPFAAAIEALMAEWGRDYAAVAARKPDEAAMRAWFDGGLRAAACFPHVQRLDRAGLRGRLLSSSAMPRPGQPGHAGMLAALDALFDRHAVGGTVALDYDTRAFAGTLH
ncbi:MAG: class I SAM-dependent methyltransferase [Lysobacteraceae bacterium]